MNKLKFEELELSPSMKKAIADMGFEEASPIQSAAIPPLLAGRDIIGQAQTGTGKTAAFAVPMIENLDRNSADLQGLVLCPTRELVIQVTEEFRKLLKYMYGITVVPVYGGQEIERQLKALRKKPLVIVGTPGRLMDHMRRGSVNLKTVRQVVLDEADEMLDMGFRDDIEFILKDTPAERQTAMFSATMSDDILRLVNTYLRDPQRIDVSGHRVNAPKIDQAYFEIPDKSKPEALARLLDFHNIKLALVFCNTRNQVDALVEILKNRGYFAEGLHGDMSQNQRDKVMNAFRNGSVDVLVATDVAGRGIDVNDIEAVFNYDLPRDDEDYIHRIGRTGRMGKTGKSFTFVSGRQMYALRRIEKMNGITIARQKVPTIDDLDETRVRALAESVRGIAEKGTPGRYMEMVESLMGDDLTAMDIAAALLKITIDSRKENYDGKVNFETPAAFHGKKPVHGKPGYGKKPFRAHSGQGEGPRHDGPKRHGKPRGNAPDREGHPRGRKPDRDGIPRERKPDRGAKPWEMKPWHSDAPRDRKPRREGRPYGDAPKHGNRPHGESLPFGGTSRSEKPDRESRPHEGQPKRPGKSGSSRAALENKFYEKKARKADKRRK